LPPELAIHSNPKTKAAADAGTIALIDYLKKKHREGNALSRASAEDITVGAWIEKFTAVETSPRTGINASKNRPYSPGTVNTYRCYFTNHIKGDPLCSLKMSEVEEDDALEFVTRLSVKKLENGNQMSGSRTFAGVIIFVRMAFKAYQRKNRKWLNPFQNVDPPSYKSITRDALPEDEILKLFYPGVLKRTMELAVCSAIFLSGLRRSEVAALKPEDLDWNTPKITVRRAWQNFDSVNRVLGPPKGKKARVVPFDPILQEAIKKLWDENGKHEFVFCWKNGEIIGPSWTYINFKKWLVRAGIDLNGREIVPHSSRHSLASLLEEKGVPLRYIQELLGHSDLKTTKIYLHSTEKTLRIIGEKYQRAWKRKSLKLALNSRKFIFGGLAMLNYCKKLCGWLVQSRWLPYA
jgi:integrase/recombinase XerD